MGWCSSRRNPPGIRCVGTVIAGKYRIDGVIGRGGMGAVYRATHVMLNKTVAVKTIKPDLIESAEMVQRFQREARAATGLEHPNIVAVYDLGQAEDGALYIAMEFVNGVNLKDAIRCIGPDARRTDRTAAHAGGQCAGARPSQSGRPPRPQTSESDDCHRRERRGTSQAARLRNREIARGRYARCS